MEEFVTRSLHLLSLERAAELDESESASSRSSVSNIKSLVIGSQKVGLYGRHVVVFESARKTKKAPEKHIPANAVTNGDIVSVLSGNKPLPGQRISGVVIASTNTQISVAIDGLPDTVDLSAHDGMIQLVKLANDVTYRRIRSALETLQSYKSGRCLHLISVLFGETQPLPPHVKYSSLLEGDLDAFPWRNPGLNTTQQRAVLAALSRPDVAIIHGPPGTGKTTTVVELILQALTQGMKVLACAPSNVAVDNLVSKLAKSSAKVVRVGHPARLEPAVLQHSLDAIVASSDSAEIILDVRQDLDKAYMQCRRASDKKKWRSEIKTLKAELKLREEKCVKDILSSSDVVLCTLTGASPEGALRYLSDNHFDMVVIDECAQALEASCWIPLLKAPRCVLAGDHCQLPPTILSQEASDKGFSLTLMERLVKDIGNPIVSTLSIQYRMNTKIMAWPSHALYSDQLTAHESVENHLLSDLRHVGDGKETSTALVFIDTAGCGVHELETEDSESKGNEGEADLVFHHIKKLRNGGVHDEDIAVIAPYSLQVELVRQRVRSCASSSYSALEVHTVDGFQGREKEAVIITLTRSNKRGEYGFLKEQRRSNVAVTRARRHLCIIGDSDTVSHEPFMKGMVETCHRAGEVWSAHEYMQEPSFEVFKFYDIPKQDKGENKHEGKSTPAKRSTTRLKPVFTTQATPPKTTEAKHVEKQDEEQQLQLSDFHSTIHSFMNSDSDALTFPTSLTGNERKIVHEFCEQYGLLHTSKGTGKDRFIEVRKVPKSEEALKESLQKKTDVTVEQEITKPEDAGPKLKVCDKCGSDVPAMNFELHDVHCGKQSEVKLKRSSEATQRPKPTSKQKKKQMQCDQSEDFDKLIAEVTLADSLCKFSKCSKKVDSLGFLCKFCHSRFCMEHRLAEVHGCADAAKEQSRKEFRREMRQDSSRTHGLSRSQLEKKFAKKLEEKSNARQRSAKKKDRSTT